MEIQSPQDTREWAAGLCGARCLVPCCYFPVVRGWFLFCFLLIFIFWGFPTDSSCFLSGDKEFCGSLSVISTMQTSKNFLASNVPGTHLAALSTNGGPERLSNLFETAAGSGAYLGAKPHSLGPPFCTQGNQGNHTWHFCHFILSFPLWAWLWQPKQLQMTCCCCFHNFLLL